MLFRSQFGFQYPRTGIAFAGFNFWDSIGDNREYIEVKLIQPLDSGIHYCVEFWVNNSGAQWAIDAFGLVFTKDSLITIEATPIIMNPDIENPSGNIITDTLNWTKINGTYLAKGGEQFITIGNFLNESDIHKFEFSTIPNGNAYYLVDDVSVIECEPKPPLKAPKLPNVFTPNGDGINDVFEAQNTEGWQFQMQIYNRWGVKVYEGKQWEGKNMADGVYYYVFHAWADGEKDVWLRGSVELIKN